MTSVSTLLLSLTILAGNVIAAPLVDPTRPSDYQATTKDNKLVTTTVASPTWELQSTLIDPYQKIAVINGQQLKLGEIINGAELLQINHNQVKLRYQGEFIVLDIKHSSFLDHVKAK
jgi:hypothetical protein